MTGSGARVSVLTELSIRSFALIDALTVPFGPGFSVLTGETGAGKSIMVDALSAALGERISSDMVRSGAEVASIDAVFDASGSPRALAALEEQGLRDGDDCTVVLTRQIGSGRSSCRVNGRPVTLGVLQAVSRHLVDIHGQHEHQALIHEDSHLEFLDHYGGAEVLGLREAYGAAYGHWQGAQAALEDLRQRARDRAQRLDVLRYQVQEIREAEARAEEEDELLAERKRLQSVEKLRELASEAELLLGGDTESSGATAGVQAAAERLQKLAELDGDFAATAAEVASAAAMVTEAEHLLHRYGQDLEADPYRLEQIERRLDHLARLKRKYGDTLADVLSYEQRAAAELAELENAEEAEERLAGEVEKGASEVGAAGEALSAARQKLAAKLAEEVSGVITTLGMPAARFAVELTRVDDPQGGVPVAGGAGLKGAAQRVRATRRGLDVCRFLLSANAGEELRPLAKVASGGELSRLMLAFKSLCSRGTEIPTIVFDEIDVGIGGQTAHQVGGRLRDLARHAQVLCVTHLPQIAGLADHHLAVDKAVNDGRTVVSARLLTAEERVSELARMLGAAEDDPAAREHAARLLGHVPAPAKRGRTAVVLPHKGRSHD